MVAQFITSMPGLSFSAISEGIFQAASAGGRALMQASASPLAAKSDGSPVTLADLASDKAIQYVLTRLFPAIPIISEESAMNPPPDFAARPFFLVDPLDGTKEFMAGHTDFAVCIGLIAQSRPVAGLILAPLQHKAWFGALEAEEWDLDHGLNGIQGTRRKLVLESAITTPASIITSRSHADRRSARLLAHFPEARHASMGAALKFTAVARGDACLYPRGSGSMEWDTAAGEAILLAAGGFMAAENGKPMVYGRAGANFLNGPFMAGRSQAMVTEALLQWDPC
jgi:3'(2'), 5'-bisphosphate nucleotidase